MEGHTRELSLNCLTQVRILNIAVDGCLSREYRIEVRHVLRIHQHHSTECIARSTHHRTSNTRFERRVYLLLCQQLEIYVIPKEGVPPDLFGAVNAQPTCRVARKETDEDAARFRIEFGAEYKRVVEDLLVHLVGVLC